MKNENPPGGTKLRILDARTALAILADAVKHCASEDIRTPEVYAALDFLAQRAARKWPFDQFRNALDGPIAEGYEAEGRHHVINASLNGIRLAIKESRVRIQLEMDSLARRYKDKHDKKITAQMDELIRKLRELEID